MRKKVTGVKKYNKKKMLLIRNHHKKSQVRYEIEMTYILIFLAIMIGLFALVSVACILYNPYTFNP
jgi:lipopolysaccharide export LptBFGC system permease protein LptF